MLNIKPLMEIRDGKIELVESVISRKKAISRMLDLIEADIAGREPVRLGAFHAAAEEDVKLLLDMAVERFHPVETVVTFVSPVIGSHTGPGNGQPGLYGGLEPAPQVVNQQADVLLDHCGGQIERTGIG